MQINVISGLGQPTRGGSPGLCLDVGLTTTRGNGVCEKIFSGDCPVIVCYDSEFRRLLLPPSSEMWNRQIRARVCVRAGRLGYQNREDATGDLT